MDSGSPLFSTEGSLMESDSAFLSTTLGIVLLIVAAVAVAMCLANTASALKQYCCGPTDPQEGRTPEHRPCLSSASQLALAFNNAVLVVGLLTYLWRVANDMQPGVRWCVTVFMLLYFASMVYVAVEILVRTVRIERQPILFNPDPAPAVIGIWVS